jgi:hypothetical protein
MPDLGDESKPVGAAKPRDDVYTVLQALAAVVFIVAIVLVLMELQDPENFGYALFGKAKHAAAP